MKKSISEIEGLINETQDEIYMLRGAKQTVMDAHTAHIKELEKKLFDSRRQFVKFRRQNSTRLHSYSAAIQTVRSDEKFTRNIILLEGQLCQSLHQMQIQENQLKILKHASRDILSNYQIGHDEVLRGKQIGEHLLMKAIVKLDDEKKEEEERLQKKTSDQEQGIQNMRRELHEKYPQLFPPLLKEASEETIEEAESIRSPKKGSFFKAAQMLTLISKRGAAGGFQPKSGAAPPEEKNEGQQRHNNITSASPSCISKIHDVQPLKPQQAASSPKDSSPALLPEMPSIMHIMSRATVAGIVFGPSKEKK